MNCFYTNNKGLLKFDDVPIDDPSCEFMVLSAAEIQDYPTLANIFQMPIQSDMQAAFMLGFALPLIVYLTSWGYQSVINFIQRHY